jgi:hypothetical protein
MRVVKSINDKEYMRKLAETINDKYFAEEDQEIAQIFPFNNAYIICLRYKDDKSPVDDGMFLISVDGEEFAPFTPIGQFDKIRKAAQLGVKL